MTAATTTTEFVRPRQRVLAEILGTRVAFGVPVVAVLYWFAIPAGVWHLVLAADIAAVIVTLWAMWRYHRVAIELRTDSVLERGFFISGRETRRGDVRAAVMIGSVPRRF